MLVPVLDAIDEADSLVIMTKGRGGGSSGRTSMTVCSHCWASDKPAG